MSTADSGKEWENLASMLVVEAPLRSLSVDALRECSSFEEAIEQSAKFFVAHALGLPNTEQLVEVATRLRGRPLTRLSAWYFGSGSSLFLHGVFGARRLATHFIFLWCGTDQPSLWVVDYMGFRSARTKMRLAEMGYDMSPVNDISQEPTVLHAETSEELEALDTTLSDSGMTTVCLPSSADSGFSTLLSKVHSMVDSGALGLAAAWMAIVRDEVVRTLAALERHPDLVPLKKGELLGVRQGCDLICRNVTGLERSLRVLATITSVGAEPPSPTTLVLDGADRYRPTLGALNEWLLPWNFAVLEPPRFRVWPNQHEVFHSAADDSVQFMNSGWCILIGLLFGLALAWTVIGIFIGGGFFLWGWIGFRAARKRMKAQLTALWKEQQGDHLSNGAPLDIALLPEELRAKLRDIRLE